MVSCIASKARLMPRALASHGTLCASASRTTTPMMEDRIWPPITFQGCASFDSGTPGDLGCGGLCLGCKKYEFQS